MENSKRYLFLDVLKLIALILMPCIHVYNVLLGFELVSNLFNKEIINTQMGIIYLFTPTIFMFCMGCGLSLSKNNDIKSTFNRGLKLLLSGLLLNLIRAGVYFILAYKFHDAYYLMEYFWWLWGSDILYFAGLYFLLFSIFKKLKLNDTAIILIAILMSVVSHIIPAIPIENDTLSEIIGNFIYVDEDSCFSLLSWAIYPTVGYLFMNNYKKQENKTKYVKIFGLFSLIIFIFTIIILFITNNFDVSYFLWGETNFRMDLPTTLLSLSISGMWVCLIYYLSNFIHNDKVISYITYISRNLNLIYLIHWPFILYLGVIWMLYIDVQIKSIYMVYPLGIAVFLISCLICYFYNRYRKK